MSSSFDERLAGLAALRPARAATRGRVHSEEEDAARLPAQAAGLADLLGAQIERNRYGAHLVLRQWHSSPESCDPNPKALDLLLPARNGGKDPGEGAKQKALRAASDAGQWLFLDTEACRRS